MRLCPCDHLLPLRVCLRGPGGCYWLRAEHAVPERIERAAERQHGERWKFSWVRPVVVLVIDARLPDIGKLLAGRLTKLPWRERINQCLWRRAEEDDAALAHNRALDNPV